MYQLTSQEIKFYYTRTDQIKDQKLLAQYWGVITDDERKKTERFVFAKDRHSCLVTRALARYLLSLYTKKSAEGLEFVTNQYGKPFLQSNLAVPSPSFNLSHSSGLSVCALTMNHDIGVDVEGICDTIDIALADRFFAREESAFIRQFASEKERERAFYKLWTLKEAYVKARGMGFSIPPDSFAFRIDKDSEEIRLQHCREESISDWQFFQFMLHDNLMTAIAVRNPSETKIGLKIYECLPFEYVRPVTQCC